MHAWSCAFVIIKQYIPMPHVCAYFAVFYSRKTLFNIISLALFEKNQTIEECILKVLEKSKISTGKHELVDSVEAYRRW